MTSNNGAVVRCLLSKNSRFLVAWLSEGEAHVGNVVDIDRDKRRDPGWRIISASVEPSASQEKQQVVSRS